MDWILIIDKNLKPRLRVNSYIELLVQIITSNANMQQVNDKRRIAHKILSFSDGILL